MPDESQESHQLINQSSGDVEIYTPPEIVQAARECMGGIDLDPATCEHANLRVSRVMAPTIFTAPKFTEVAEWGGEYTVKKKGSKERVFRLPIRTFAGNGGLDEAWFGRVWLNHPFGRAQSACPEGCTRKSCRKRGYHLATPLKGNSDWVKKAIQSHAENTEALCMICFASTSESWFRPLLDFPQCYLTPRTNYIRPDGTIYRGVTKGSVVTYLGRDLAAFCAAYEKLGSIKVRVTRSAIRGLVNLFLPRCTAIRSSSNSKAP